MKIRWKVPIKAVLRANNYENIFVDFTNKHKDLYCTFKLLGEEPEYFATAPDDAKYIRLIKYFSLTVTDSEEGNKLSNSILSNNHERIYKLLINTTNRFIGFVRNFGGVANLNEIKFRDMDYNYLLVIWSVEIYKDEKWAPLLDDSVDSSLLSKIFENIQDTVSIDMAKWPEIEEAIQLESAPTPEMEFTTNALEHLINKNFRYAVVESVIGLEIALSRYMTEYLTKSKGFGSNKIKDFLSHDFGLYSKLSGLLDLTLHPEELKLINTEKVKNVVKWRNHIAHRTGHLPEGVSEDQLMDGISAVLALITILGYKARFLQESGGD